ncbi:esterase EstP [Pseudomonas sp. EA_105y_Pfl2_R69]|uniref:esterase EstP n=1 Tax=Pseudomonas sp. EA_105y_Pfl2_R69 TaxID=3088683 RepID=UPI0030D8479F
MKRLLTPLAAACLLAASPSLVLASPYSGLVVFGDSLSDAGQFSDPGGPDGATRRFTNRVGPTYQSGSGEIFGSTSPMLLGELLGLGPQTPSTSSVLADAGLPDGSNWAVGGYRTDQILDSITAAGGSVVGSRTRDGYLLDLANRGLSLDPNMLFYVNGGGNDFLQGTIFTDGAQVSAGRLADGVEALQAAGARYIMVSLLPDVGSTPAISGTGLAPVISQIGQDFNVELVRRLEAIDAQIIPLNVPLLFSEVLQNAAAYGFDTSQNLIGSCFDGCANVNATWGINSATPDPSKLLFNDSVHPTTAVQQIFADYSYSLLAAPWELTLLPEMAHGTLRAHQDQLRTQLLADWEAWQAVGQWRAMVSASGQRLDFDSQRASAGADGNGYSLDLGTNYRLDEAWRVGVSLGVYEQELQAGRADSDYDMRSYLATAFAQYQHNRWWGDLSASAGYLDYQDLKRKFDLGVTQSSEKGDSEGQLWALSGRLGYDIAQPGSHWHLSPFLSADYARVEVDGYAEEGARSTALTFADQTRTSKRLGFGFQGNWMLGASTQVFAEIAREKEYEDDAAKLNVALNSLPSLDFTLQGYQPDDRLDRLSLGFSQQLSADLALRGAYSLRKGEDDKQQGVNLALTWNW